MIPGYLIPLESGQSTPLLTPTVVTRTVPVILSVIEAAIRHDSGWAILTA